MFGCRCEVGVSPGRLEYDDMQGRTATKTGYRRASDLDESCIDGMAWSIRRIGIDHWVVAFGAGRSPHKVGFQEKGTGPEKGTGTRYSWNTEQLESGFVIPE